jgi:putative membrane protein
MVRSVFSMLLILLPGVIPELQAREPGDSPPASSFDQVFARRLLQSIMAASEFDRVAVDRAAGDEVRKFAQSMLDCRTMMNDLIKQISGQRGVISSSALDKQADSLDRISALTGSDFDRFYLHEEYANQREQAGLCRREVAQGADPKLKSFAADCLARLRQQTAFLSELVSAAGSLPLQ